MPLQIPIQEIRSCLKFMEIARIPRWPTKSILQDLMLQNLQQFHNKLAPPFDIISVASLLIHSNTPRRGCKEIEISAELVEYLFWNTGSGANQHSPQDLLARRMVFLCSLHEPRPKVRNSVGLDSRDKCFSDAHGQNKIMSELHAYTDT